MQLSKKQKLIGKFSLHLWSLDQILNILKKTMTLIAYVFPELRTANNEVREMSKKSRLRRQFDKQHCKRAKTLLKSSRKHLYHIFSVKKIELEKVSLSDM